MAARIELCDFFMQTEHSIQLSYGAIGHEELVSFPGNYIGCCSINLQKLAADPLRLATTYARSWRIPMP
jgi:hypothetical protein